MRNAIIKQYLRTISYLFFFKYVNSYLHIWQNFFLIFFFFFLPLNNKIELNTQKVRMTIKLSSCKCLKKILRQKNKKKKKHWRNLRTYNFQTSAGFDTAVIVLHDHPVKSRVLQCYLNDFQYLHVVPLLYRDSRCWGDHCAVLVPFGPGRRVADHGALETHRFTLLDHTVVGHRVKFRRTDLWPLWQRASWKKLRRP